MDRREFLAAAAVGSLVRPVLADAAKPWLRKTLKIGMIRTGKTLTEKFSIAKQAGFEGVELNVPFSGVDQAKAASESTGLIIDGTVGGYHWKIRHTDPDPKIRDQALAKLKEGLRLTAAMGADTMLLVPGHGKDGTPDEVYARAVEAIKAAVPTAQETGVSILIENVWNHFLYDHEGDSNQTADALAAFVDEFDSQWVGIQYDIGNHWKYGDPAAWIKTLDSRIKKLDIKGFSRQTDQFTKITEGDIDWQSVESALREIGFTGWLAAEVQGGDLERLLEISAHLDESLHCGADPTTADRES